MAEAKDQPKKSADIIRHFCDLIVWQRSFQLSSEIYTLSKKWPVEERYALTDQMRRSSRAIGAAIAESWGKRRYEAAFIAKLSDADDEAHETEHWLTNAEAHGFLALVDLSRFRGLLDKIGRMLGSMMAYLRPFLLRSATQSRPPTSSL